jgi:hypothetical protein
MASLGKNEKSVMKKTIKKLALKTTIEYTKQEMSLFTTILTIALIGSVYATQNIGSLNHLNAAITTGPLRKVGFLSAGNFHSVQNELHHQVEPAYYDNTDHLHQAVESGEILAGLVSGTPKNSSNLNVFGSEQISVRAMLVNPGEDDLLNALDAALVRIIQRGDVERIAEKNAPYQALAVHSCKPTSSHFTWPALENNTVIKIAALGPYDWGGTDGDYTTEKPFLGFWPDYYNLIEQEFKVQYNIAFERVWYKTSGQVLDSIANGVTHTTEPYMMMGAAYNDQSRKTAFDMTCITSATQDKYFTKRHVPPTPEQPKTDDAVIIAGVVAGVIAAAALLMIYVMYRRERRGKPIFSAALLEQPKAQSVEMA